MFKKLYGQYKKLTLRKKNEILTIGVFTLLAVNTFFFAYGYVYEKSYLFQEKTEIISQENDMVQEFIPPQNQVSASQISDTPSVRTGDITLISPQDGEVYCFGQPMKIQWTAPEGMESVGIIAGPPGQLRTIATLRAYNHVKDGIGYGEFYWDYMPAEKNYIFHASDMFKIMIEGDFNGLTKNEMKGFFTVKDCEE